MNCLSLTCLSDVRNTCFICIPLIDSVFTLAWCRMSQSINKEWMTEKDRVGVVYLKGIQDFIDFAKKHVQGLTTLPCPCTICRNRKRWIDKIVKNHLVRNGIDQKYTVWALHGENSSKKLIECLPVEQEENMEARGLGLENLVDSFYGVQDKHHLDTVGAQAGVFEEPYAGNDKYSE